MYFVYVAMYYLGSGMFCVVYQQYVVDVSSVEGNISLSSICFRCVFSRSCRNISATVFEMGDPIETPFSGW